MTDKLYDIIARTSIELGHKTDGKTMAALTKIFANDVATDKRLKSAAQIILPVKSVNVAAPSSKESPRPKFKLKSIVS